MTFPSDAPNRLLVACLSVGLLSACNDPTSTDSPYIVTPVTSAALSGTPGWTLTDTLVVEVRDAEGNPVPGAKVTWSLPNGGRLAVQLADADNLMTGTADDRGRNYAVWTLGLNEGPQVAKVASGVGESTAFTATATALHVLDVTVGSDYACAILTDQRPVCWGGNGNGELGVGDRVSRATPTPVVGLATVLQIVASPNSHTCARDLAGDVWCWGYSYQGEAGPLASGAQVVPVRVPGATRATTIDLGYYFSCAILNPGGARCWGYNRNGRLGADLPVGNTTYPNPQVVYGGSDFVQLTLTDDRACAVDTVEEVWCWGAATSGELSPYPSGDYSAPIQPIPGYKLSEVALNWYTNCGIAIGGVALCWGANYGLGHDGSPWETSAPISPRVDGSFAQITADEATFYGRTRDGRLVVWGFRLDCCGQQLSFGEVPLPVRIIDVAGAGYGYCVIAETGALYCDNSYYGTSGLKAFPAAPES